MLRPAGPRISSMMPGPRSGGRYCCNSRSVASKLPISAPDADIRDTNSSIMSSTTSTSTVLSVDITSDSSRTSSSSSICQILPPYCSPSASISIAARFGPGIFSRALPACRAPRVAITLVMSVEFCACELAIRSLGGLAQPLANNGGGFVGISFGEFAHAVHRLGVDLALDLGDVDEIRRAGKQRLARRGFCRLRLRKSAGQGCHLLGSEDALDQRPHHHEHHHN